jgi:hypothetical protein
MTRGDRKTLFTALAFFAVVAKGKDAASTEAAEQIHALAGLVEEFCAQKAGDGLASAGDETSLQAIDMVIERHVRELRDAGQTHLAGDRTVLMGLHDRLEQRKMRRTRREFYASATEAQVADLVLELLDDEIESNAKLA